MIKYCLKRVQSVQNPISSKSDFVVLVLVVNDLSTVCNLRFLYLENLRPIGLDELRARLSISWKIHITARLVNFREGGKPRYPKKNPQTTWDINYGELNSHESLTHERRILDLIWIFQWRETRCPNCLATRAFLIYHCMRSEAYAT